MSPKKQDNKISQNLRCCDLQCSYRDDDDNGNTGTCITIMARITGLWASICFLFLSCLFDLISCPHSKVEESFQLQATHDLYYHGISPALRHYSYTVEAITDVPYDHLHYPGGKLRISNLIIPK